MHVMACCTPDPVRERMVCTTPYRHNAHNWEYDQDWGGSQTFYYHCPGIKDIVIITHDNEVLHR